jgi:hypothetical protein
MCRGAAVRIFFALCLREDVGWGKGTGSTSVIIK